MQFSTLALSAAFSIGSAFAAASGVTVHVVRVGGSATAPLTFSPNNIVAAVGDMVQFQFAPANHTVTQSTFDQPCQPIAMNNPAVPGFFSGFMPTTNASATTPTYTIQINNTTPIWLYCSQGKHCQMGMSAVINQNLTANASRSLTNYQSAASGVAQSLFPGGPGTTTSDSTASSSGATGGTAGTTSSNSSSSSGTGSSSSPGSATTSGGTVKVTGTSAASSIASSASSLFVLVALGVAGVFCL